MIDIGLAQVIVITVMVFSGALAVKLKNLLAAVLALALMSLLLSLQFYFLHAPDVAIAEAAVGAVLTTAIYVFAIRGTHNREEVSR